MSYSIEELNKLIEEIEKDKIRTALEIKRRKRNRFLKQKQKENNQEKFETNLLKGCAIAQGITLSIFLLTSLPSISIERKDNIFEDGNIVLNEERTNIILTNLEKELDIYLANNMNTNIDNYLLLNAIKENSNLSTEDKDIFYQFIDLFEENSYINKEKTYESLLNVDIEREKRTSDYEENIAGIYYYFNHNIKIFEEEEKDVITHEGIHCIFSNELTNNLPKFLKEGVTELLAKEYYTDDPFLIDRYPFEIAFVKMLCEIIDTDIVLESYTTGNMELIYNELSNFSQNSEISAEQELNIISKYLDMANKEKEQIDYTDEAKQAINYFDQCYKNSDNHNSDVTNDYDYYYNKSLFKCIFTEERELEYNKRLFNYGFSTKAYFNQELKETGKNKVMKKI